ncbi:SDR family oxidoreductase [Amycolatopsis sp. NPDC047767]|uniref:SDR family oxidoreductase n=1 Tax=Amycolatopsis sp. NPDC047767 TaxID=3156765 RepID=UPI0034549DFF
MSLNGSIADSTALITGSNRGLGAAFTQALLDSGVKKVYATARNPEMITAAGVTPIALDVTDHASVVAAAERAQDVTLLINNAGITTNTDALHGDLVNFQTEFTTNALGALDVTRTFAPILARNGGGAVLNVLSGLSWVAMADTAAYCASKSAAWSITNSLRQQLAGQNTQVTALHMGFVDTDLIAGLDVPKADPADIVRAALEGLEKGEVEVVADDISRMLKSGLSGDLEALYEALAGA